MSVLKEHWLAVTVVVILLVLGYMYMKKRDTLSSWLSKVGINLAPAATKFGMMDQTAALGPGVTDQVGLYNPGTVTKSCRTSPWQFATPYGDGSAEVKSGLSSGAQVYKTKKARMSSTHSDAQLKTILHPDL